MNAKEIHEPKADIHEPKAEIHEPEALATESGPRILILSAGVGSGHNRAAAALEAALQRTRPNAYVQRADVLDFSIRIFRYFYGDIYIDLINKAPDVLRFFYNLMDEPRNCSSPSRWDRQRVFLEKLGLGRFLRLLRSEPWDLIINTHFLPGEIIAQLKRAGEMKVPQMMVTTDFETTHMWITEPCELYTTATKEAAVFLQRQGVAPERTIVTGIPIDPVFCAAKSRQECRRRHGLSPDRPLLLQLNGGHGVGRIERIFRALLAIDIPLQLVVVTGRNPAAQQRLASIATPPRHQVKILGYTTEIDELMRAADLIVSKPGGLTTCESLACGTPLVIVDPVPGQEERNSDMLLEAGAAVKVNHLLTLNDKITEILRNPERLEALRNKGRHLARPRAAFDVVEQALQLLDPAAVRPVSTSNGASANRKSGPTPGWFDQFEVKALHFFARTWHHCSSEAHAKLPIRGPAIIVANHVNYSDPAFLIDACGCPVRFFHAAESFGTPILHALFARAGSIAVARNGADVAALRIALRALKRGEVIGVFPEGEVMPNGEKAKIKSGAAYLALKSRAPVYPVRILGGPQSGSIIGDWLKPSERVRVIVDPPIDLSAYYGKPINHRILGEVTAILLRHLQLDKV